MGVIRDRLGRELSRFELGVAAVVVSIIVYALLERVDRLHASVERARLTTTLVRLETSLELEIASRLMASGGERLAALEGANPMAFSGAKADIGSGAYRGELAGADPEAIPGGHWYFDLDARALVYRVENEDRLVSPLAGPARVRFGVRLEYEDRNGNGRFDPGSDRFRGARLEPLERYAWVD